MKSAAPSSSSSTLWSSRLLIFLIALSTALCACSKDSSAPISGVDDTGIIRGREVRGSEPWAQSIVALAVRQDGQYETFCTGTLFDDRTIVTAAHCLEEIGGRLYILFGKNQNSDYTVVIEAEWYKLHEGFDSSLRDRYESSDIGLVRLKAPAPPHFRPALLLTERSAIQRGRWVLLAGFGATNGYTYDGIGILRYSRVQISDPLHSPTEVATDERRSGTCNGDSGGPAFIQVGGTYFWWGVTARGSDNHCRGQGFYTRVAAYVEWINSNRNSAPPRRSRVPSLSAGTQTR